MDRRIEATLKVIHEEIHRNVPVHELAQGVRLSTGHFIRLFKAETSLSPKQYVRWLRMKQAETLLHGSFLSVKEIAARLGVGDRSHFSRDFKKFHGRTPTHGRYRKQSAQQGEQVSMATKAQHPPHSR
jgi:AraC family transcriptional regulator, transcriptional activator of pobA